MEHYDKREIQERVKNHIDNFLLHIELEENDFFLDKYKSLQELIPEISLVELGEKYVENYKKIVKYYKENMSTGARLRAMTEAYRDYGRRSIFP